MDKNIQSKQESDLNKKEHTEKQDKRNCNKKEEVSYEENTEDEVLKETQKISENIHDKPAEEQQFENKD